MNHFIGNPDQRKLDSIDLQIISMLQKDGRATFSEIAESLQVSPGMIRIRYNRLVEAGYVKVVAISNPIKMGFNFMAMVGIRVEGSKLNEVAERIARLNEVIYLIITSGAYDLFAEVICTNQADLLDFLSQKLSPIDGVRETEAFIHLKIVKEVYF
jgi:Lrp/AsnC family transcriptional regulator, regulator for asnA, asnC and gidA